MLEAKRRKLGFADSIPRRPWFTHSYDAVPIKIFRTDILHWPIAIPGNASGPTYCQAECPGKDDLNLLLFLFKDCLFN